MNLKTRLEERDGQTVFVINRKEWATGLQGGLLWDAGLQMGCCLGLAALAEGTSCSAIVGVGMPASVRPEVLSEAYRDAWLRRDGRNKAAALRAAEINDQASLDGAERERLLARWFAKKRGWLLEFED